MSNSNSTSTALISARHCVDICIDCTVKTDLSRIPVLAPCILYKGGIDKQTSVVHRISAAE